MDLPVELRLEMTDYVVTSDQPIDWRLLPDDHWPLSEGTFGLQKLNIITQVYRQFREETTGLVWKINPIHFYGMDIGIGSAYSWSLQWIEKAEA
jgi:hypothetical protein